MASPFTSPEDAPKESVFKHYRNLLDVEDAFRETKSYLEMRPIHHQKDSRVRNHIRICFLAYWISPNQLYAILDRLNLLRLFTRVPGWAL